MKLILCLIFFSQLSFAKTVRGGSEKWKTFKSNLGFRFEYPECFKLMIGDAYAGKVLLDSYNVAAISTPKCASLTSGKFFTIEYWKDDRNENIDDLFQKSLKSARHGMRFRPLIVKDKKDDSALSYVYIERMDKKTLRWQARFFCFRNKNRLNLSGPEIKNGEAAYKKAVSEAKKGNLFTPQPFNRMFSSARCP